MVSTFIGLLDIQSWWEIPCISHFCSLFSSAFDLPDIDIEDLESALLSDGTTTDDEHHIALVPELIVRLLKGCDALRSVAKEITHSNYQMFLRRFLRQQCRLHNTENHFDTDIDFQSLPVRKRLLILYDLCHFRLDSTDVQVILNNLESDSLRVEPLGYDSKNSGYWYFYGTRLYREDKPAASNSFKSNSVWQVICFTEEDWQNLATKFKTSTNTKEKELYQILDENFLPKLPQLFRERERLRRRKLFQVRNSSRIRNLIELKARQEQERQERQQRERQRYTFEQPQPVQSSTTTCSQQTRARRCSQSTSTASGISTYASSLRRTITTNSSDFLGHRETFCLTPEDEEEDEEEDDEEDEEEDLDNAYCRNHNHIHANDFGSNEQINRPIDDTANLLTDEHLNLLKNIKLEPVEETEQQHVLNKHKALQQKHNDNQNKDENTITAATALTQDSRTPVEEEEKFEEEINQKSSRKSHHHHHHHHHKKKKSQKKQKKKSKEHRRKHKHADKQQNELTTTSTQNQQTENSVSSTVQQQPDKQPLPTTRSSKHSKSLAQYHTIEEEEPVLSPEDKENFCRAIGVVPTESLLHLHNNHNTSNELDSSAQEHNNDLQLNPTVVGIKKEKDCSTIYDMAPATNMKLPGRQTNNSLSSLTGNIFIPTTLQDSTTATSTTATTSSSSTSATIQQQQSLKDTTKTKTTNSSMANKKQKSNDNSSSSVKGTAGVKRKTSTTASSIKPEAEKEREDVTTTKSNVSSSSQNSEKSADDFDNLM